MPLAVEHQDGVWLLLYVVFGTVEEVKRTNLYSVLLRLYLWYLDNKRLEKMYANGKSK